MAFDIITVTPTLSTDAYGDNEVLFISTEIKLPHNKCKLVSLNAIWNDSEAAAKEMIVMFFKENTHELGSVGAAPNITGPNINTNVYLGAARLVNNAAGEAALGTPTLLAGQHLNNAGVSTANLPKLVLAEGSTKNTCYIQGLYEVGASDTFAADSLVITVGVEY